MNRIFFIVIVLLTLSGWAGAQVSTYAYQSYWATYTEINDGTILGTGATLDDNSFNANDIGFNFNFNGVTYTQFSVNTNGFIAMGSSVVSSNAPISTGTSNNIISAASQNLLGNAGASLMYQTSGEAGSKILTIQWRDFKNHSVNTDHYNFQIKLFETSNEICLVYGDFYVSNSTSSVQVGLRGNSNADFNNRQTTTNWLATTTGTTTTAPCYLGVTAIPAMGLTFSFNPVLTGSPSQPTNSSPANNATNLPVVSTLNWLPGANTTACDLWFGPKGNMTKVIDNQAPVAGINTYTTSTLLPGSVYEWRVVEHNASGICNGPVWSFTTVCGVQTVPFTENFDNYIPTSAGCGTIINANGDAVKWETRTGLSYSGFNRLHIGYNPAGQPHNDWYITPGLILTGMQTYQVNFYYKGGSPVYVENLEVKWGDAPTVAGMSSPAIFSDVSFYKANYTLASCSFTPSTTGTYYIGWHCFSLGNQISVEVDQITVAVTPLCIAPSSVLANAITSNSANISWTGGAANVRIQYGTSGFAPGTSSGTVVTSSANGYTLSGLAASTSYDVYVQQDCGSGIYSAWTGPVSFTTQSMANKTLNLKLYLEGLYSGVGQMRKAQGSSGDAFPGYADKLSIELRNASTGIAEYTLSNVLISSSGQVSGSIPQQYSASYYIAVKHRNSIETCTSSPVSFTGSNISYDFSTAPSQAYGNNMKDLGDGRYGLYAGDVNQDGTIDALDLITIDNGAAAFLNAYLPADANGDGKVDSSDANMVNANVSLFISTRKP